MSTWINADYFFARRGRVFQVSETVLREYDINLSSCANPRYMGDMAQAALDRLSKQWPEIVPPGSSCMALQWAVYAHVWEFCFTHGSIPFVPEGEEFQKATLNWRNEDGSMEWRRDPSE